MAASLTYRRLRAPREDGGMLLSPDWQACQALPESARQTWANSDLEIAGLSLQQWRRQTRTELLRLAAEYSGQYLFDLPALPAPTTRSGSGDDAPLIISGHQPHWFHCGVWAKNFFIDRLAAQVGGIPLQIIIDNDLMREHSVRVPVGTDQSPRVELVPYDDYLPPIPYENRRAIDRDQLLSFPDRVRGRIQARFPSTLLDEMWPDVMSAIDGGKPLGGAFAEARHRVEHRWGLRTWELPLSRLCDTTSFRRFVWYLLTNHAKVRQTTNHWLQQYRLVHRLRSNVQPLPDLAEADDWCETPLWTWTDDAPQRQPLWCRRQANLLELSDRRGTIWTVPDETHTADAGLEALADLHHKGVSIRPRALSNTLYLRLLAADVFVHGIGGAKYDQITDRIAESLFQLQLPRFVTLSLSALLPVSAPSVTDRDVRHQQHLLRQMQHHPEKFLDDQILTAYQVSSLAKNKQKWVRAELPKGQRKMRHREIRGSNAKLLTFLQEKTRQQAVFIKQLQQQAAAARVWANREWAFCLYPADFLKSRLLVQDYASS